MLSTLYIKKDVLAVKKMMKLRKKDFYDYKKNISKKGNKPRNLKMF